VLNNIRSSFAHLAPALAVLALAAVPAMAQQPTQTPNPTTPMIATTARGETQVTPDRATVAIGVETRGQTAAAAASANATRQTQVIDAIKGAGIPAAQIRTVGFNVMAEYAHEQNRAPRVTGYRAINTVLVEVRQIDQVGKVLDTALAAGANNINSISFFSSKVDEARRDALARAVEMARADAEAMARAAGGSLGAIVELSSVEYNVPFPRPMAEYAMARAQMADAAPTPIEPGEYTVSATVTAKWQFVAR
jgi:uncharacterized protein YggE